MQRADSVEERYHLGTSLTSNGSVERELGHYDLALNYYCRGLAVREGYGGMVAADPKDVQAFEDLASGESTMSVALDLSHSPQAAFQHQQIARRMFASSISRYPGGLDLAKLRRQLHIEGAATAAAQAVRDLPSLAARSPQSHEIGAALQRAEELSGSMR